VLPSGRCSPIRVETIGWKKCYLGRSPEMFPTTMSAKRPIFARWRKPRQLGGSKLACCRKPSNTNRSRAVNLSQLSQTSKIPAKVSAPPRPPRPPGRGSSALIREHGRQPPRRRATWVKPGTTPPRRRTANAYPCSHARVSDWKSPALAAGLFCQRRPSRRAGAGRNIGHVTNGTIDATRAP